MHLNPKQWKLSARKLPLIPNLITALGLLSALFALFRLSIAKQETLNEHFFLVIALLLLVSALADFLDGAIARLLQQQSVFGTIFDSLSDAISFGVVPCVMALKSLSFEKTEGQLLFLTVASMVYTLCGVLRLVRFHLISQRSENIPIQKNIFVGLPITASAAALISLTLWLNSSEAEWLFSKENLPKYTLLFSAQIVLGYLMVSRWKFFNFKTLRIPLKSFESVFGIALIAVCFFGSAIFFFSTAFLVLSWLYIFCTFIFSVISFFWGDKIKWLKNLEPEQGTFLEELDASKETNKLK